jgi:hypothetical protein
MPGLESILADYLRRIGQYEPQPLGKAPRPSTAEDAQFLREALTRQLRFNNSMIMVAVAMLCGLFLLEVFLIVDHRDSLKAVSVISGTAFAGLLLVVRYLRRLWLDKSAMDILILTSHSLPPAETARLVTSFYFKAIQGRIQNS